MPALSTQFNLEALIDAIAERVAVKLRADRSAAGDELAARLFDIESAARYLRRTPQAVRHLVATGKFRRSRLTAASSSTGRTSTPLTHALTNRGGLA